jgi:hypothetical protein
VCGASPSCGSSLPFRFLSLFRFPSSSTVILSHHTTPRTPPSIRTPSVIHTLCVILPSPLVGPHSPSNTLNVGPAPPSQREIPRSLQSPDTIFPDNSSPRLHVCPLLPAKIITIGSRNCNLQLTRPYSAERWTGIAVNGCVCVEGKFSPERPKEGSNIGNVPRL